MPPLPSASALTKAILDEVLKEAHIWLRKETLEASETVANSYVLTRNKPSKAKGASGSVRSPYYWSGYLDQGRSGFSARRRLLIYFRDPSDDPRTNGGRNYPRRKSDIRRLTAAEFQFYSRVNYQNRLRGLPPVMVVRTEVGPAEGAKFTQAMEFHIPEMDEAARKGADRFSEDLAKAIGVTEVTTRVR